MMSKRVVAFLALAVFPPAALTACGSLFHKDVDAGADAAVVASAEVASVAAETVSVGESVASVVPVAPVAPVKRADAGAHGDAAAPAASIPTPTPDAGAIPRPLPSGLKIPTIPSNLKIPSGFPKLPR